MNEITNIEAPVNVGNPRLGWASDVAAEMLRRAGIKYVSVNPGASYRGFHDSIINYLGNSDPKMLLCHKLNQNNEKRRWRINIFNDFKTNCK